MSPDLRHDTVAGPAPDGQPLVVTVECTAAPSARFGTPHRVTIHPDWSVTIPHDLDAERIARSMGSWNTCLHVADRIVPAYRGAIAAMLSSAPLPRDPHRLRYELDPEYRLGAPPAPADAGLVDTEHRLYRDLLDQAGRVWSAWGDPRYVSDGVQGYQELWRAGVPPLAVERIARQLPREAWPLPGEFYSRLSFEAIDLDWLITVLGCYPTSEVAMWATDLSPSAVRRYPAEHVWRLYDAGVDDRDARAALDAGVDVTAAIELASRPGVGATTAVRWLTAWSRVGATPTPDHYRLLERHRVLLDRPPLWLVDWTVRALRTFGRDPLPRTELAVMLALTSDVNVIREAVSLGIASATDPRFTQLIKRRNP